MSDPELRMVLELATDEELMEFEEILYGTSYFSPLLKSIAKRPNSDYVDALDDIEERDIFISKLESRFLYLAADARSIIRNVLLGVRRELGVRCSSKLCTADLEAEIFLHLLDEYSSRQKGPDLFPWNKQKSPKDNSSLGVNKWMVLTDSVCKIGAKGLQSAFLKVLYDPLFYCFPLHPSTYSDCIAILEKFQSSTEPDPDEDGILRRGGSLVIKFLENEDNVSIS